MRSAWALLAGIAAVAIGTAFGWNPGLIDAIVSPPAVVRATLVAGSLVLGLWLLGRAVGRIAAAHGSSEPAGTRFDGADPAYPEANASPARGDLAGMVRAVRLVFLAVAAFAAAGGWLLGSALPLIVALVIAGVDVIETSFLLLVVAARQPGSTGR